MIRLRPARSLSKIGLQIHAVIPNDFLSSIEPWRVEHSSVWGELVWFGSECMDADLADR